MRNPNSVLQEILNIIPKTETEIIKKDNNWFNTWKLDMISILTKKSKNTLKMELNLYKNLTLQMELNKNE